MNVSAPVNLWFAFIVVLFAGWSVPPGAAAQTAVTVLKADGRAVSGLIDARSDLAHLWLRSDAAHSMLVVSVAWDEISAASLEGVPVPVENLAAQLLPLATNRPVSAVLLDAVEMRSDSPPHSQPLQSRPSSLQIAACLANWDSDAEPDGIEIHVMSTDRSGYAVPVRGNLQVRLMGLRQTSRHRHQPGELSRWSQRVSPDHFGPPGSAEPPIARYRLPFRSLQPSSDWRIGPEAVVHARLGVYGVGNMEASTTLVLRQFSPLRDELQLATGRRHFPIENARVPSDLPRSAGRAHWPAVGSSPGKSSFRVVD